MSNTKDKWTRGPYDCNTCVCDACKKEMQVLSDRYLVFEIQHKVKQIDITKFKEKVHYILNK